MLQPTRLISTPFAQEGEKTEIQNVTGEFDNSATYRLGFPPITMQSIRLGGKPPKGTDFNGVLFDITENISFLCKGGRYQYNAGLSTLIGGYPEGSNLLLDDNVTEVVNTVAGNQNNPNTDMTGWILKPNRTTAVNVADASGETQQQVNYNGGAKWYSRVGGYLENERVVLANGDIVKSTIDGNVNDPNVDMTGWVKVNSASQIFDISGKNQQEINTNLGYWDGGLKSYIKFITYEALGAKFDGVTDDTAAIQAGNDLALAGFTVRAATSHGRARITSTVTFYAAAGEIDMGTCYLKPDRSIMTSGTAAIIRGNTNAVYNYGSKIRLNLIGPYGEREESAPASPTNTLRGLEIGGGTNSQVSNVDLYIKVFGFRENVYVGQKSVYLLRFHSPMVGKSWFRNWTFDCVNDSGENISLFGGVGFNNVNTAKNAVDIYVTPTGQHLDLYLYGYSQDYNDIDFEMYTGMISKFGGHNENNSLQPYAKITYTNAMKKPCLYLDNVMIDGGNDLAQEAGNTGKPVWFDVSGGVVLSAKGGSWGKFGKMRGVKLVNTTGNPLQVSIDKVYFDMSAGVDYIDFGNINPLLNRDFSTNDLSRWKSTITSSGTIVAPTLGVYDHPRLGKCLQISSVAITNNTTTRVFQKLTCKAGEMLYLSTKIEWNNINATNGIVYPYYRYLDINGDEISRTSYGAVLTGQTGSSAQPSLCSANVRVPTGAFFVEVGFQQFQASGDFYMGALQAFVQ